MKIGLKLYIRYLKPLQVKVWVTVKNRCASFPMNFDRMEKFWRSFQNFQKHLNVKYFVKCRKFMNLIRSVVTEWGCHTCVFYQWIGYNLINNVYHWSIYLIFVRTSDDFETISRFSDYYLSTAFNLMPDLIQYCDAQLETYFCIWKLYVCAWWKRQWSKLAVTLCVVEFVGFFQMFIVERAL